MSKLRDAYLEFRDRVGTEMSESKLQIDLLKEQLANFDTSYSKDFSKSIFTESPLKTKAYGFGTFDSRVALQEQEKYGSVPFTLDNRDVPQNQVDLNDDNFEEDENYARNNDEYLASAVNQDQEIRDLVSPIQNEDGPLGGGAFNLGKLYKYFKEKQDVFKKLKQQILNEIGQYQWKQQEHSNLSKHFKTKAVEIDQTDKLIKDEIKEVKERLEVLQVIKIREKKMSAINRDKWLKKLRELENLQKSLKEEMNEKLAKMDKITQDAEDMHTLQMKNFKVVLSETENARQKLDQERIRNGQRLEEAEAEADIVTQNVIKKEQEGEQKQQELEDLKARIRQLERDIATYEEENPTVIETYKSKRNLEKQHQELSLKIKTMQAEVDELNDKRVRKQMQIDITNQEIQKQRSNINSFNRQIKEVQKFVSIIFIILQALNSRISIRFRSCSFISFISHFL